MHSKKVQKIVVYLMLGSMILTSLLAGLSMWI